MVDKNVIYKSRCRDTEVEEMNLLSETFTEVYGRGVEVPRDFFQYSYKKRCFLFHDQLIVPPLSPVFFNYKRFSEEYLDNSTSILKSFTKDLTKLLIHYMENRENNYFERDYNRDYPRNRFICYILKSLADLHTRDISANLANDYSKLCHFVELIYDKRNYIFTSKYTSRKAKDSYAIFHHTLYKTISELKGIETTIRVESEKDSLFQMLRKLKYDGRNFCDEMINSLFIELTDQNVVSVGFPLFAYLAGELNTSRYNEIKEDYEKTQFYRLLKMYFEHRKNEIAVLDTSEQLKNIKNTLDTLDEFKIKNVNKSLMRSLGIIDVFDEIKLRRMFNPTVDIISELLKILISCSLIDIACETVVYFGDVKMGKEIDLYNAVLIILEMISETMKKVLLLNNIIDENFSGIIPVGVRKGSRYAKYLEKLNKGREIFLSAKEIKSSIEDTINKIRARLTKMKNLDEREIVSIRQRLLNSTKFIASFLPNNELVQRSLDEIKSADISLTVAKLSPLIKPIKKILISYDIEENDINKINYLFSIENISLEDGTKKINAYLESMLQIIDRDPIFLSYVSQIRDIIPSLNLASNLVYQPGTDYYKSSVNLTIPKFPYEVTKPEINEEGSQKSVDGLSFEKLFTDFRPQESKQLQFLVNKYGSRLIEDKNNKTKIAKYFLQRGNQFFKNQDYYNGAANYLNIIELNLEPESDLLADAYYYLSSCYYALKQFDKFLDYDIKAIAIKSKDYREGLENLYLGNNEEAIKCFTESILKNPASLVLYVKRGDAYKRNHQYERAIKDYTFFIDRIGDINLSPKFAYRLYRRRSEAFMLLNKYNESINDYLMLSKIYEQTVDQNIKEKADQYLESKLIQKAALTYQQSFIKPDFDFLTEFLEESLVELNNRQPKEQIRQRSNGQLILALLKIRFYVDTVHFLASPYEMTKMIFLIDQLLSKIYNSNISFFYSNLHTRFHRNTLYLKYSNQLNYYVDILITPEKVNEMQIGVILNEYIHELTENVKPNFG